MAFCSSPVSRARLSVKVAAIRKSIFSHWYDDYRRTISALLAIRVASSFCLAFCSSAIDFGKRPTPYSGMPWRRLLCRYLKSSLPSHGVLCKWQRRGDCVHQQHARSQYAHSLSRGSLPWRKTEVSRSLGLGKNAAGFTITALNWLEDVRYLASSSSSAMISSSPEGSVAMVHDPDDTFDDPWRNSFSIEPGYTMPLCPNRPAKHRPADW